MVPAVYPFFHGADHVHRKGCAASVGAPETT